MRLASIFGRLLCVLCALAPLSVAAGCEAPNQVAALESAGAQTRSSAVSGSSRSPRSASQAGHAAPSGGSAAPPYVGDVPARAAGSGERPCGSSEFSVGPCGGRAAVASVGGSVPPASSSEDAGTLDDESDAPIAGPDTSDCRVVALPERVRARYQLDGFYKKYASAHGIPVLASEKPVDRTLQLACLLVKEMTAERRDVQAALLAGKVTFAILGSDEYTTDIPEYRHLPDSYDTRSRGLGGHTGLCAEENILCDRQRDPYRGQSVCVHEFAHTIGIYGLFSADSSFEERLAEAFRRAREADLWPNTLAAQDAQEYWAEGVQTWYDANLHADPADGVHGPISTQHALSRYDRALYELIDELLPTQTRWPNCYHGMR